MTTEKLAALVHDQMRKLAREHAGQDVFLVAISLDGKRVELLVVPRTAIGGIVPPEHGDVLARLLETAGTPGMLPAAYLIPDDRPAAALIPTGGALGPSA